MTRYALLFAVLLCAPLWLLAQAGVAPRVLLNCASPAPGQVQPGDQASVTTSADGLNVQFKAGPADYTTPKPTTTVAPYPSLRKGMGNSMEGLLAGLKGRDTTAQSRRSAGTATGSSGPSARTATSTAPSPSPRGRSTSTPRSGRCSPARPPRRSRSRR